MSTIVPPTVPRVTHPESKSATHVEVVSDRAGMARFQEVLSYAYWHDPFFVWPILSEERRFLDPKKNPFFKHGEACLFYARHGHNKSVARVSAAIDNDQPPMDGKKVGTFGFLEFLGDARLSEAMLVAAVRWLRERGCQEIIGPCSFNLNHPNAGLLVEGHEDDPTIDTTYNPHNYHGFLAKLPVEKWKDLYGYMFDVTPVPERLEKLAKRATTRLGLTVRTVDMGRFEEEIELLRGFYNETWRGNTGFAPIAKDEMKFLCEPLRSAIDPGMCLILEEKGKPVGCSIVVPDWNRVLKHLHGSLYPFGWLKAMLLKRTIDRVRVMILGVQGPHKRAYAAPLVEATWRAIHSRGYKQADVSWIIEDNKPAISLCETLGGKRTRTWRLFRVRPDAIAGL